MFFLKVLGMKYARVKDVRIFLGFYPIKVVDEIPDGEVSGNNKIFYTKNKPLVDGDFDENIDVEAKVNGEKVDVTFDAGTGTLIFSSPPPAGAEIHVSYFWHPFSDEEIRQAIETAEIDIDNECGRSFEEKVVEEEIYMTTGNVLFLTHTPVAEIYEISIKNTQGEVVEFLSSSKYSLEPKTGRIMLFDWLAGMPVPPWYLPLKFYVYVRYRGGYKEPPALIKQITILTASKILLSKIAYMLTTEPEYQGKIAVAFKKPDEIVERFEALEAEIEKLKTKLPRRVSVI